MCGNKRGALAERLASDEEEYARCECPDCGHLQRHYQASWGLNKARQYFSRCSACGVSWNYGQEAVVYLEKGAKSCDQSVETEFYLHGRPCQSRFCSECTTRLGVELREKVREVVKDWKSPLMWTLTLNPELFESARSGFFHVRDVRAISRLVRQLRKDGVLNGRHYFVVIEWHKNGWPHWHLLVDSNFVSHDRLKEIWGRFQPDGVQPSHAKKCLCDECMGWRKGLEPLLRPSMGSVWFSPPFNGDGAHAANYATKYLLKTPEHPYPDWVLDAEGIKIARYSTSRGFFGPSKISNVKSEVVSVEAAYEHFGERIRNDHPAECFCDVCRAGDVEFVEQPEPFGGVRSVRSRVGSCRSTAVLLKRTVRTGRKDRWSYFGNCFLPFGEAKALLDVHPGLSSTRCHHKFALYFSGKLKHQPVDCFEADDVESRGDPLKVQKLLCGEEDVITENRYL